MRPKRPPPVEGDSCEEAAGVNRSAAFGTSSAFEALPTRTSAVVVIPGRSSKSELSTLSAVLYVTTPPVVVELNSPSRSGP